MPVQALHHYTLRCPPDEVDSLAGFYERVIGLQLGDRPELPLPGAWLYAGGQPIVHIYANVDAQQAAALGASTGRLDHISFRAENLAATRRHLRIVGCEFTEAPVPGRPLHQVFVRDPTGLKIELTFWMDEERMAGTSDD
jgi:catechol 2,3-dioxygenase-like lactoylglutathione lyase family enzyme